MITVTALMPLDAHQLADMFGFIPLFVREEDPRPMKVQLHENYSHGGGWHPFEGFTFDKEKLTINYPGDPPNRAIGSIQIRDETLILFEHAWVMILQKDGTHEISRMD